MLSDIDVVVIYSFAAAHLSIAQVSLLHTYL